MSKQTQERIETAEGWFYAEFGEGSPRRYEGAVYPVVECQRAGSAGSWWAYCSKEHGGETHDALNDDCRVMFEFSFCWRGVWEGRIYFKDDEYWAEDLAAMSFVWDKIQAILKAAIRRELPNQELDD